MGEHVVDAGVLWDVIPRRVLRRLAHLKGEKGGGEEGRGERRGGNQGRVRWISVGVNCVLQ